MTIHFCTRYKIQNHLRLLLALQCSQGKLAPLYLLHKQVNTGCIHIGIVHVPHVYIPIRTDAG
jgi:hypothetical protein